MKFKKQAPKTSTKIEELLQFDMYSTNRVALKFDFYFVSLQNRIKSGRFHVNILKNGYQFIHVFFMLGGK